MKINPVKALVVALMLASLWGCVQTRPVPGYARAGDVIVLGLGGIERNSASEPTLRPSDLTITITDANDTYPLAASNVFKSYPDYKAFMNTAAIDGGDQGLGLVPFDGGWFVVVPLIEAGSTSPIPLVPGQATISIYSDKLINTAEPLEGDLTNIGIEILEGVTSVDTQYLAQFVGYAATQNNFVISPADLSGVTDIAGAFFKIDYSDEGYFKDGIEPMVVPSGHNPFVQLAYNVVPNGDGTGSINVTLLNPAGFKPRTSSDTNSSLLADLSVSLAYFPPNGQEQAAVANTKFSLDTSGSYYIDGNGDVIGALTPTFTHQSEL